MRLGALWNLRGQETEEEGDQQKKNKKTKKELTEN